MIINKTSTKKVYNLVCHFLTGVPLF